ncbi:ssDNA endodeoxyribonuclease [Blyttiomyces sp. JEL0837]|nr:ssDNA endodeoxyribonuclease [Blyttiomyces sp. JEL0837]
MVVTAGRAASTSRRREEGNDEDNAMDMDARDMEVDRQQQQDQHATSGRRRGGDGRASMVQDDEDEEEQVHLVEVTAKLDNVRTLVTLLKAIHYEGTTILNITPHGIKFTIETDRSSESHSLLQAELLSSYIFKDQHDNVIPLEPSTRHLTSSSSGAPIPTASAANTQQRNLTMQFAVSLNALLDCLCIYGGMSSVAFGGSGSQHGHHGKGGGDREREREGGAVGGMVGRPVATHGKAVAVGDISGGMVSLTMSCRTDKDYLELKLEENDVVTVCRLTKSDHERTLMLNSDFGKQPLQAKIIMSSTWLKESLHELDSTAENIVIQVSPADPFLRISASGISGDAQMDYPKHEDVLESFFCLNPMKSMFRFSLIQPALKALSLSDKISLRLNQAGFLSIQFLIPVTDKGDVGFVEFLCSPLEEESEE